MEKRVDRMSLLDKLVEKKDIDAYCRLRAARLKEDAANIKKYPEQKRELIRERIRGRVEELDKLRGMLTEAGIKGIKKECKLLWKHFEYVKNKQEREHASTTHTVK